jgi:hypothetical protein
MTVNRPQAKRKLLAYMQQAEIDLEKQKSEFKKMKLQADIEEDLARKERAEMSELGFKRHSDMMELVKHSFIKYKD